MKVNMATIEEIIERSVESFNEIAEEKLSRDDDGIIHLYGKASILSSVDLVVFLTILEEILSSEMDIEFGFDMNKAVSLKESPLIDDKKLSVFIQLQLEDYQPNEAEVEA